MWAIVKTYRVQTEAGFASYCTCKYVCRIWKQNVRAQIISIYLPHKIHFVCGGGRHLSCPDPHIRSRWQANPGTTRNPSPKL